LGYRQINRDKAEYAWLGKAIVETLAKRWGREVIEKQPLLNSPRSSEFKNGSTGRDFVQFYH
jgi:hypothetical protein